MKLQITKVPQLNSDNISGYVKVAITTDKKICQISSLFKSKLKAKNPGRLRRVYSTAISDGISGISKVPKLS